MKCLPSALNNCPRLLLYLIETELNIVLQAVLYLNTSDRQYSLCTVLLTVRLAGCTEGEVSNITGSIPWPYTYKSHRIQGTKLLMTCLPAMYSCCKLNACFYLFTTFLWKSLFWEESNEMWSYMYIGLHVKYPLFLSDFNESGILSTDFVKLIKNRISLKSLQWKPSCSILADGYSNMINLIVAFAIFRKHLKMSWRLQAVTG